MRGHCDLRQGSEEGVFAWVAANYALGMLGGDPLKTNGIIELGGASAQITFATEEALPSELAHVVKFNEATYKLYSNSFLHFGQNVAQESVKELLSSRLMSPEASTALPISTVEDHSISHASGNFSECKSAALLLLKQENGKCLRQECRFGSNYIPKLQGRFLATENFFFTSEFFGLGSVPVLSDFESAGQHFCEEDWDNLKYKYQTFEADDFARYCFSSAYIVALLHDNLGIPMDDKSRLWFANQVDGIHLDWALGAFILQTKEHLGWAASIFHFNFFSLLGIITVFLLLMFFIWLMLRLQKPQLKTVYDLEKGRYIDLYIEEANFASAITHPLSIA
ncbi:hypothetical protein HPP92_015877 [Vanilla planifolia]|uniref:Apyrase n=1 Tax=Vanilla planifolia TaxID=51239 RepID=A0A835QI45_VANPL|nr:hypothetical protein HPP92_015877 [Vanilla planifolia]